MTRTICGVSSSWRSAGILVPSEEQKHQGRLHSVSRHLAAVSGWGVVVGGGGVLATGPHTASFL